MFNGNFLQAGSKLRRSTRNRVVVKTKRSTVRRNRKLTKLARPDTTMRSAGVAEQGVIRSNVATRSGNSFVPTGGAENAVAGVTLQQEDASVRPEFERSIAPNHKVVDQLGALSSAGEAGSNRQAYAESTDRDLLQVGSVPLLSREEEVELARRIKEGDESARERMIRANLRLVIKIARDYEHLGLPTADLVSEGIIGLMKAVERFDPAKGGKLSTYGSWWIKQQIRRALANQGRIIRLPVHVEGKLYQLGRVEARLRNELGREATDEELAAEVNSNPRRVARLRNSAIRPTSMDAPVGDEGSASIAELVADERAQTPLEQLTTKVDHELIKVLLQKLPEREQRILRLRFGLDGDEDRTLEEVGEKFGLTRERIRQLQNEAFKKLRALMEDPELIPVAA
jgi:RNA polymerase primary sigma factor